MQLHGNWYLLCCGLVGWASSGRASEKYRPIFLLISHSSATCLICQCDISCSFLLGCGAVSLPFGYYQIMLLGIRDAWVDNLSRVAVRKQNDSSQWLVRHNAVSVTYHAAWVMAENLPMKSPARAVTKHFPLENCGRPYRTWRKKIDG